MSKILILASCLLFFSSCSVDSKSDLQIFRLTAESLERSNQTISQSSREMSKSLYQRLTDPKTAAEATVWQPKAKKISEAASPVIQYITALKSELKDTAGYAKNNTGSVFQDDNIEAVNKIFIKNNKGEELYKRLKGFVAAVDSVDEWMNTQFADFKKASFYYLSSADNEKVFSKTYFNQISTAAALSLLAKFENDILNTENMLVTYCYNHNFPSIHKYEAFQTLVTQSSTYVKAGEEIEITAGIGSFSSAPQLRITIDGNVLPVNEYGFVTYKFKTPAKGGQYNKPVKMEYFKPDGTQEFMTKNIAYTVIEEK